MTRLIEQIADEMQSSDVQSFIEREVHGGLLKAAKALSPWTPVLAVIAAADYAFAHNNFSDSEKKAIDTWKTQNEEVLSYLNAYGLQANLTIGAAHDALTTTLLAMARNATGSGDSGTSHRRMPLLVGELAYKDPRQLANLAFGGESMSPINAINARAKRIGTIQRVFPPIAIPPR